MKKITKLSIVVPCFNEEEVISKTYSVIKEIFGASNFILELIFIDDGSTDETLNILKSFAISDESIKVISFSRNFGHQPAVTAGLNHASGDVTAIIDADLQDPPCVILEMLNEWRNGAKVVYAVRKNRKESVFKKAAYFSFYRLYSKLSDIDVVVDSGDFCLMDKSVVSTINSLPEKNRFNRGLRSWVGFKQVALNYDRDKRNAGETKYSFSKLINLAMDGVFNFSSKPLGFVFFSGVIVSLFSFLLAIFYFVYRVFNLGFLGSYSSQSQGFTTIVVIMLLLGSLQILAIGVIGQYISRIYQEVKSRPSYIVKEFISNEK